MYYGAIKKMDTANGPGLRVSLFVSGCQHKCKGCFNEKAQSFSFGKPFTQKEIDAIISALTPEYIEGFTLLGGEPLDPHNQEQVWNTIKQIKKKIPEKTIRCYTGYTYEYITKTMLSTLPWTKDIIENIDVLIDGRFELELLDIKLAFRGSRNQRVINMPLTQKNKCIIRSNAINDKEKYCTTY